MLETKRIPLLETLEKTILCLVGLLVTAGCLRAVHCREPAENFIRSSLTEIFTGARRGDCCGNLALKICRSGLLQGWSR